MHISPDPVCDVDVKFYLCRLWLAFFGVAVLGLAVFVSWGLRFLNTSIVPAAASMAITTIIAINSGFEELVGLFTDPEDDDELDKLAQLADSLAAKGVGVG